MHAAPTDRPRAGRVRATGKVLAAAAAPLLLAALFGLSATGPASASPQQPQAITVAPSHYPGDTSWGGCGGACSQQP